MVLASVGATVLFRSARVDDAPSAADAAPELRPVEPTRPPTPVQLPATLPTSDSIVGEIVWGQPTDAVACPPASGVPDAAVGWCSDRGSAPTAWRTIGGSRWRVGGDRNDVVLEHDDAASAALLIDDRLGTPAGLASQIRVSADPAGGFPVELGGELFLLARQRIQVPWPEVDGRSGDVAHRVRVAAGEREIVSVAGDHERLPTERYTLRPADDGVTYELVDSTGGVAWTYAVDDLDAAIDAITGRVQTLWLRWDGQRFRVVGTPWPTDHRVEMVAVGDGVLATSADASNDAVALWHSADGDTWTQVDPPAELRAGFPVGLAGNDDEAIVSLLTDRGWTIWSTVDGTTFHALPAIPGITNRTRGVFGWVAPDPRSAPRIRVSPDGERWEVVNLSELLGFAAAEWETSVEAEALGDTIVVTVTREGVRSVLVGQVAATVPD